VWDRLCTEYEGNVTIAAGKGRKEELKRRTGKLGSNILGTENLRANYGMIRVMQSVFMASSKLYYTSRKSKGYSLGIGPKLSGGGSASLGEMEMSQLEASGLKECIQEFKDRADSCVVDICNGCRCISMLCHCDQELRKVHGSFKAIVPASSIKLMTGIRVCSGVATKLTPQT
jgi:hypothetical protein